MNSLKYWAVLPAAGIGSRMDNGNVLPKQYWTLQGCSVLERSMDAFLSDSDCRGVMVALAAEDAHFKQLRVAEHPKVHHCVGGATRRDSVLNGLNALRQLNVPLTEWVMVHDAARPGLSLSDVDRLKCCLLKPSVSGALLALSVIDTIKRVDKRRRVTETVDRFSLVRAQTPQVFLLGALMEGLLRSSGATDESMAMEAMGVYAEVVEGTLLNQKLTTRADFEWLSDMLKGSTP